MTTGPNTIVVGAMRAGTTALAQALAAHPHVALTEPKEPNYFATLHGGLDFRGPGDQWFAQQNTADWADYEALFDQSAPIRMEASAAYLALPQTAASIAERRPDCRIVVMLREPLTRARSAHGYLRTRGRESVPDFEAATALESSRRADGYGPIWWYRGASDYAEGLQAYLDAFGEKQVHVVVAEDLSADPAGVVAEVCGFLGLEVNEAPLGVLSRSINAGGAPRNALLTRLLYPPDALRSALRRGAPPAVMRSVRRMRARSVRPLQTEPSDSGLAAWARDSISATESVLGRRVDAWHPEID